ncbi:MAG: hypothetical protein FWG77_02195 [Treponema sp.]|nr:hypothetical protein [Treponema sp.]
MECMTLELLPEFKHRYKSNARIYNIHNALYENITLFFDLGCYNTLIPKRLAVLSGHPLGFTREYKIGGTTVEAEAYSIEKIMIKDFALERIVAFAAEYTGEFASDILIGTNVMNNWKMIIDRKAKTTRVAKWVLLNYCILPKFFYKSQADGRIIQSFPCFVQ